jgi:hypothetical protein
MRYCLTIIILLLLVVPAAATTIIGETYSLHINGIIGNDQMYGDTIYLWGLTADSPLASLTFANAIADAQGVNGDTWWVYTDTYTELINLGTKDVDIVGISFWTDPLTGAPYSDSPTWTGNSTIYSEVSATPGDTVSIIDGIKFYEVTASSCIQVFGRSGICRNIVIDGMNAANVGRGAIFLYNNENDTVYVNIDKCTFRNDTRAIALSGDGNGKSEWYITNTLIYNMKLIGNRNADDAYISFDYCDTFGSSTRDGLAGEYMAYSNSTNDDPQMDVPNGYDTAWMCTYQNSTVGTAADDNFAIGVTWGYVPAAPAPAAAEEVTRFDYYGNYNPGYWYGY